MNEQDDVIYRSGEYKISIKEAKNFDFYSKYDDKYDRVFKIEKSKDFSYIKAMVVSIEYSGNIFNCLFIVDIHTPINECAVPHGEQLFLMLNWDICILDLQTLKIVKQVEINDIGTMFAAYPYENDFILYGELQIVRIDSDLNVRWKFYGNDIFVRCNRNEPAFIMKKDRICLYDWNEDYCEIDYNGNLI